jgi:dipeptidyl aminopeptidase/acylaminoacyl peptidase
MVSVRRYCSSLLAMFVLFACAPAKQAPAPESQPRSFTPKRYSVEDFYKNTAFQGASWAPDKSKVLVSSDASGIWNAYAIPAQGGEPQALTNSTKDTIVADSYFPADERILYSSDQGGNELTHVYVRNPDGTTKDLTPGAKLKANFIGWAGDDKSFLVSTNERDARYFDVYEIGTDGYKRTLLYKNTDGYDIGPVSRDKRYVALIKSRTTSDADIFLFDRTSNTTKNITAHTGNVSNLPAAFSPDSLRLMFLSDSGREFASLRSHDIASGMQKTVFEPQWDVQSAQYSKAGKYLVVSVNEDARPHDVVLDASTFAPVSLPGMPQGIVQGMSISADDSAVAFYATDGSLPTDLYAGNFASAPRRLTNALNPSISREDMVAPERVRFKSYDGLEIPGVLYRPHQASPQTKVPAIVRVHGGPGGQAQVGFSPLSQAMANHGYAVFDINNRGSSGYGKTFYAMDDRKHGEADLGDVVASKQMLIDTGYVETNSIGIFGGSYGGYMVLAALTLKPGVFKVGVDMFGISNWIRTLENTPAWWGSFRDALFAEMGDPKTDRERLTRISPLFHADNINVPLMVLQGANDPRVLKTESDDIVAAAKKNGVPVSYVVFPDEGHGFVKKENEIRGYTAVLAFLDEHLRNGQQAVGK